MAKRIILPVWISMVTMNHISLKKGRPRMEYPREPWAHRSWGRSHDSHMITMWLLYKSHDNYYYHASLPIHEQSMNHISLKKGRPRMPMQINLSHMGRVWQHMCAEFWLLGHLKGSKKKERQAYVDAYANKVIWPWITNLRIMRTTKWAKSKCTQDCQKVCTKLLPLPDNAPKNSIFSSSAEMKICQFVWHIVNTHTK